MTILNDKRQRRRFLVRALHCINEVALIRHLITDAAVDTALTPSAERLLAEADVHLERAQRHLAEAADRIRILPGA